MNCVLTLIYFKNGIEIGWIFQNNLYNQDNVNSFIIQILNLNLINYFKIYLI